MHIEKTKEQHFERVPFEVEIAILALCMTNLFYKFQKQHLTINNADHPNKAQDRYNLHCRSVQCLLLKKFSSPDYFFKTTDCIWSRLFINILHVGGKMHENQSYFVLAHNLLTLAFDDKIF